MRRWILLGVGLGSLLSALSWFGNLRSSVHSGLSTFPDLITLLAVPVLTFLALLLADRHSELTRETLRSAAMVIVGIGATLFATCELVHGMVVFSRPSGFLLATGFVMALLGFVALGWLSAWAASNWLIHADGKR